jgi:hypothetical protein
MSWELTKLYWADKTLPPASLSLSLSLSIYIYIIYIYRYIYIDIHQIQDDYSVVFCAACNILAIVMMMLPDCCCLMEELLYLGLNICPLLIGGAGGRS